MIGENISHYKILEKLGEGGMGVVYKAEDTKLKRIVALKFLPPELTKDPEAKERFVQEAQAASALEHHNICNIHQIDETDEGQTFIVMACYEGESLREEIERGPIKLDEAIDIGSQIAQGLARAHEKGIVHRDIKPANIHVTCDGVVKILDFGLAKLRGKTKLTKEGTTLGTVAYMSPEQARGEKMDHRTDIWSLGIVLYEMITGQCPFKGEYEQSVMYSILNEELEPVTGKRTGVPFELERMVNKCLEKDPAERYQTATDLVADFRHFQRVTTTQAMPSKSETHRPLARPFVRRLGWVAGLVLVAAIAVVYIVRQFAPSEMEPISERKMLVVLPFENLGPPEDEYFADGITEEITSRLASLHDLGVISRTSAFHYKDTDKTVKNIGEELNVDYVLEGTVRWQRVGDESRVRVTPQLIRVSDDTHLWSERYDRILQDIFSVQSEIAVQVIQQLNITLLEPERQALEVQPTENIDAYHAYLRGLEYLGDPDYLKEKMELAVQMFERAIELDPNFALAFADLSRSHSRMYHWGYDRTPERLARAKAAVDDALKLQPDLPQAHRALGLYYYWGHLDYDRAFQEFSLALTSLPNDPDLFADIAYIWRRQGRYEQAIKNQKQAVKLNPQDSNTITQLAISYMDIRRYSDAVSWCNRSISLAPDQQMAYLIKALCYWAWKGELDKSRAVLEEIPDIKSYMAIWIWYHQALFERNYQDALYWVSTLPSEAFRFQQAYAPKTLIEGLIFDLMEDSLKARSSYESALIFLERAVQELPEDPRVHRSLGLTYAGLGSKEAAIREGRRAVELCPVSKDVLRGSDNIIGLVDIYLKVGEYDMALDQIEYLLSIPNWYSIHVYRLHPLSDPLRHHPRYKHLLEKYSGDDS
ncbi:MAG: protein kinase [Gemmatimonadota bacterium]|nr:MAG: protein kinase [Gemmatimonadota bacterium]